MKYYRKNIQMDIIHTIDPPQNSSILRPLAPLLK